MEEKLYLILLINYKKNVVNYHFKKILIIKMIKKLKLKNNIIIWSKKIIKRMSSIIQFKNYKKWKIWKMSNQVTFFPLKI